jgi:hypothetical protein
VRAIGGIVRYKAIEWAAHIDKQGLPPSSFPPPLPAPSEASNLLVKRSKDGDAGYNLIVEAGEL